MPCPSLLLHICIACRYIWESGASGSFAISEDKEGEPLGRGTKINIYLKETVHEYLQQVRSHWWRPANKQLPVVWLHIPGTKYAFFAPPPAAKALQ